MGKFKISRMEAVEKQLREIIGRPQVPSIAPGELFSNQVSTTEQACVSSQKRQKTIRGEKEKNTGDLLDEARNNYAHTGNEEGCTETRTDIVPHEKSLNSISTSKYSMRSRKTQENLVGASHIHIKHHNEVDLANPIFHAPLNCGWKREVVHRLHSNLVDVYYWPPKKEKVEGKQVRKPYDGQLVTNEGEKLSKRQISKLKEYQLGSKLRSYTEVVKYLDVFYAKRELTIDNFTFTRKPLGLDDPDKEVVRRAVDRLGKEASKVGGKVISKSKSSKVNLAMSPIETALGERFVNSKTSSLNRPAQKLTEKPLTTKIHPVIQDKTVETPYFVPHSGDIRSPQVSTSSESMLPLSQQHHLANLDNQISSSDTTPPCSSESSIQLRLRLHRPLYDEKKIMKKFQRRPLTHSSPRKSRTGHPNRNKHRAKSSSTTPILCMVSSSVSDASQTAPSSTHSSEDFQMISAPIEVDPLALPDPEPSSLSEASPLSEFSLSDLRIDKQTTEPQNQISSTLDLVSRNSISNIRKIKVEPEIYIIERKSEPIKIEAMEGRDVLHGNEQRTSEIFQCKVFMRDENALDDKVEIRRFSIQFDATPMYDHLCKTLQTIFPDLKNKSFALEWKDFEGDRISVSSCMELKEAIKNMRDHDVMKFYLTVHSPDVLYNLNLSARIIPSLYTALK